jgi:hypothetical protein
MPGEIRDIRMMQRALEQRWPIKPEYRDAIIRKLVQVVVDPSSSARESVAAAKGLIAAEAQNQKDEQTAILHSDRNRFLEIAQRLGLSPHTPRVSGGGTGNDIEGAVTGRGARHGPGEEAGEAEPGGGSGDTADS